jgi:Domain of unknown function (DUF4386)
MDPIKKQARIAGWLYLLISIPVGYCLTSPHTAFVVADDAAATAQKIKASEFIFRLCMASEIFSAVGFLFVALALYRVFVGFSKPLSSLMVTLWVVSMPISCLNLLNKFAVLHILQNADPATGYASAQGQALLMLFLDLHRYGIVIAQIFWGLWLLPLGIMIIQSRYLPRIIGALVIAAACAYPIMSLTFILAPSHADTVASYGMIIGGAGELPLMLWLIVKGANVPQAR